MNRKLYDAVSEDSDWSVAGPFLYNLAEALVRAGFDARIIRQEGTHYFLVDDEIKEEVKGNTSGAIWALFDTLAKKNVSVELHPKFGLLVEGDEQDRHSLLSARRQREIPESAVEEIEHPEMAIVEEMLAIGKVDNSVQ
jgi:hypothetical protein